MSDKDRDDERALFRAAVGEVRPVRSRRQATRPAPPPPRPLQRLRDEARLREDLLSDAWITAELQPGDVLSYASPGLQKGVLRKLRRGEYRREAELDLHGLDAAGARRALSDFLHEARAAGRRCVRIIHGKGLRSSNDGPVLKSRVNTWLRQRREVLAFCSARPDDGGTGAVYVLLRRAR